jgi:hypothetical protein
METAHGSEQCGGDGDPETVGVSRHHHRCAIEGEFAGRINASALNKNRNRTRTYFARSGVYKGERRLWIRCHCDAGESDDLRAARYIVIDRDGCGASSRRFGGKNRADVAVGA